MSKTRMGKRVASLLLSLVMMLSLLPTTVYATGDTGDTTDEIVGQATTAGDNTEGTGEFEPTGEGEDGSANVTEGEDGAATNDAVVEETIAPVNAEGVDAVANAESSGDEQPDGADNMTSSAVAKIVDKEYATLDDAIKAVQNGEIIEVNAGEYKLNGSLTYTDKAFTIAAAKDADVSFDMSAAVALHGAKITFNGVTFNYKTNNDYTGIQHADTLVYDNCTINGKVFLYAASETFNNCKFVQKAVDYNVWTYGAQNVAFNGCIFNCAGKAVLVYNEGAIAKTDLTVTDTKFIASAPVEGKAAIEIDTSLMKDGTTITIDAATEAEGFAEGSNSKNSLWNDKVNETVADNKDITVIVNNETVYAPKATASAVAKVDNTEYATLQAAIDAANAGDTVTLLANTTEDVAINKNITLDLGGKTLTNTSTGKATISVSNGATATVKNGSVVGGTSYYNIEVTKGSNANLTLEDVTATAGNDGSSMIDNWGTLTIESGDYKGGLNVVKSEEGSKLTITGGTFTLDYAPSSGYTATILVYGDTTITGGEFIQEATPKWGNPQVVMTGVVEGYTAITRITGGTFTNKKSGDNIFHGLGKATSDNFEVSGGTFNKSISDGYCADGFIPTKNADGTYGVKEGQYVAQVGSKKYETLADAIRLAANGKTVTLLADVTENVTIAAAKKNLTLDLNGKTLNGGTGTAKAALTNYGTITIKDSSADKAGTIKRDDTGIPGETSYYVILNQGTMTIEGGNVINNSGYEQANPSGSMNGSSLICNGDCDEGGTLTIKGGTFTQKNFIAIKNGALGVLHVTGGTITSDHSAIQNWFNADITGGEIKGQLWTDAFVWDEGKSVGQTTIGENAKFTGEIVMGISSSGVVPMLAINGGDLDVTSWRITTAAATAGAKPAVSGGTFTSAVPAEYCAAGYIPTKNEDGSYGVKEGAYVAQIGEVKYATLADAIAAAESGATITLLADCASERINLEEKSITVDLNGKTLTSTAAYGVMFCAKNGNTITINGTIAGSKLVGTLMVTTGTNGHIVINGGTYENAKYCPIYINGAVSTDDSTLTVTNATIKALAGNSDQDNGVGVYLAGYSTSIFTNTTIAAPVTGLEIRAGKLTLTDCNVTGGNGAVAAKADGSGSTVANAAVAISQHTTKKNIDVTINGGTYTATAAVYQTDVQKTGSENVKASIESGMFNGTVSAETDNTVAVSGGTFTSAVPENCCANGYIPTKNEDGSYGVKEGKYVAQVGNVKYETLQEAINKASRNATVKLLADTRENVTISTPYLTLDLNGFTLNGSTGERKPALTVTARVTVKDSSKAQTGTIMREDTAENSGVSSHYVIDIQGAGWLTFESGNVKNDSGAGGTKGASLVRVGDDSDDKYPGLNIKGGTFTQDNFIVIKVDSGDLFLNGGTLSSKNSYAIENWHRATVKGGTVNGTVAAWTYSGGHNSDLEIIGGTVNGNVESVSYDGAEGKLAKVKITGGTVNGTLSTKRYNNATAPSKDMATIEVTGGTFSSDPTKYLVECSAVTQNADGTYGVAKAYLARIGETFYYTMEDAFQAQTNDDTIVLLRDYTTGGTFNSGSINRTVDLNGHTWTCTGTDANSAAFEINYPNASLTVKNGKIVSSQLVGLIPSAMGGTIKYDNSSLTFENVEMSTTATSGIETNGNNTNDSVKLVKSTLNVPNGFGIYFPSSGKLTIDNSTITAKTMGVQVCAGSLSINSGSTITVSGDGIEKAGNDGAIQDGAAISIVNRTGYKGLGNVTVTGGTFTAKTGNKAIKAYDWKDNTESAFTANDKINVSGGTFSSAVKEEYCATGYIPTTNSDGTHTVKKGVYVAQVGSTKYESLAAAIGAAQDGDTVTLLKDIDLPATAVVKGKTITLDLNGKTISNSADICNESKYAWSLISVRDNGDLTINDTTGGGKLKAKENDCFALDVYAYDTKNVEDTKLTINAGNYVGNISAVYAFTGKATINGGHFSIQQKESGSDPYRLTLNCYDSSYTAGRAGFTVNGGTFENFDPRNNPAEGAGTSFVAESVGVDKNTDGTFTAKPNMAAQIVDAGGGSVAAYAGHYDAIAAAKDGETVILLSDRKNFVTNTINANITIDLNGKTLSVGNNNPFFCTNGEVTIQNGTIESNYACAIVNAYNKLTLKNVKITGVTGDSGKNLVNVCSNAEVTIDKDTVLTASGSGVAVFIGQNADAKYTLNVYGKVIQQNKSYAISGNGSYEGATTINIYEGAEVRSASVAIYHPQAGEINVYGGLVEGYCGIGIKSGTLNITGGQVLGVHDDDELSDENSNPNGMTYDGSAIIIDSRAAYAGNVKINISGDALVQSSYSTAIREIGESAETTNVTALNVTGGKVLGASGKAAIQLHGVTADVTSISGGEFSSIVKKEYCAPGFTPVTTANSEGRYGVEIGKFTVQVTSRTVSSESPVANVSGGGSNITYAVGTTVTAASLSGYKFVGWFVNEYVEGNEPVSKELSFKFQPTDHCKLIAVYEPISGAKFYLTVNASEFTVGESAVYDSYMHDQVAAGESVTVTFKGTENFLYWVNASRKVVSTNPAYTFIMGSETTLSAVYGKTREAQATVVFMSDSDQIITSKAYKSGTAIQFPTPPIKMGCTFEAWSMTEKKIQDAIAASNNGVIVVKACYTDPSTPYTVTVLYPDDTKEEYSGMVGKTVTLTAKKISGKTFSYWRDSKNNVLGYTTTLMLAPSGNITVTAVYGDTAEVKPVITMTAVEAGKAETSYYVISFTATRAVPEGYTVVKQGILYSVDSQCTGEGAKDYMKLTDEGSVPAGIYEFEGNNTELSGVTLLHAKVGAVDRTIYGRGYMVLKNSSGTMEYVYSDNILSGSYSGLTKIGG